MAARGTGTAPPPPAPMLGRLAASNTFAHPTAFLGSGTLVRTGAPIPTTLQLFPRNGAHT